MLLMQRRGCYSSHQIEKASAWGTLYIQTVYMFRLWKQCAFNSGPGTRPTVINLGQMKTFFVVALSTIGFFFLFRAGGGSPGQAQSRSDIPSSQFRISVGWKDTTARQWKGKVAIAGGELLSAKGYRFSQKDQI